MLEMNAVSPCVVPDLCRICSSVPTRRPVFARMNTLHVMFLSSTRCSVKLWVHLQNGFPLQVTCLSHLKPATWPKSPFWTHRTGPHGFDQMIETVEIIVFYTWYVMCTLDCISVEVHLLNCARADLTSCRECRSSRIPR